MQYFLHMFFLGQLSMRRALNSLHAWKNTKVQLYTQVKEEEFLLCCQSELSLRRRIVITFRKFLYNTFYLIFILFIHSFIHSCAIRCRHTWVDHCHTKCCSNRWCRRMFPEALRCSKSALTGRRRRVGTSRKRREQGIIVFGAGSSCRRLMVRLSAQSRPRSRTCRPIGPLVMSVGAGRVSRRLVGRAGRCRPLILDRTVDFPGEWRLMVVVRLGGLRWWPPDVRLRRWMARLLMMRLVS